MLNSVSLIGRLGADPEVRYTGEGKAICEVSVACSEKYKDNETTEWFRCTCFGAGAENMANICTKGSLVYISGKLRTESYEKDGEKKFSTKVIVREWKILASGKSSGDSEPAPKGNGGAKKGGKPPADDDMIPF